MTHMDFLFFVFQPWIYFYVNMGLKFRQWIPHHQYFIEKSVANHCFDWLKFWFDKRKFQNGECRTLAKISIGILLLKSQRLKSSNHDIPVGYSNVVDRSLKNMSVISSRNQSITYKDLNFVTSWLRLININLGPIICSLMDVIKLKPMQKKSRKISDIVTIYDFLR